MAEAFDAFDLDGSGQLDIDETREMFRTLLRGRVGAAAFSDVMLAVRQFADHEGTLTLNATSDAVVHVLSRLGLMGDERPAASPVAELASPPADETASRGFNRARLAPGVGLQAGLLMDAAPAASEAWLSPRGPSSGKEDKAAAGAAEEGVGSGGMKAASGANTARGVPLPSFLRLRGRRPNHAPVAPA